jgi:chromosome partitioning protein
MLPRMGLSTLAVDLDPQANLTSSFFDDDILETLWDYFYPKKSTILSCVKPVPIFNVTGIPNRSPRPTLWRA